VSEVTDTPTERPGFVHRRERHGLIGPFGGRQLAIIAVAVVVVAVGLVVITTPLGRTGPPSPNDPKATQFVLDSTPLGYIGSVEDVAAAAVYLASDEARYVTGQVLGVDGGLVMM